MINSILKVLFATLIALLAILVGALVGQLFALISVGAASVAFAIGGIVVALPFAYDFIKNELYGKGW